MYLMLYEIVLLICLLVDDMLLPYEAESQTIQDEDGLGFYRGTGRIPCASYKV